MVCAVGHRPLLNMSGLRRLGNFFIAIGVVFLTLFFISDYVEQVKGWYLLIGAGALGLGMWLASRGRNKPEPSQRFRMVRLLMGKDVPQDEGEEESEEMDE